MTAKPNELKISPIVSLPLQAEAKEFIPVATEFIGQKKILEQIALGIVASKPVLLIGDTGVGKTSAIRYLAALTKNGFRRLNLNGQTGTEEIIGKILLQNGSTYWVDGVLIDAMRKGYWILLDEINAASPEVLFAIHSLLDDDGYIVLSEHSGEIVKPHPHFRLFAAMNPSGDYAGTKEMNQALISRFYVVKLEHPVPAIEQQILKNRAGITEKAAEEMVAFAGEVRKMKRDEKIQFTLSTRELIQWAELWKQYRRKYLISAEMAILNKLAAHEISSVTTLLGLRFKKLDGGKTEVVTLEADKPIEVGAKVEVISGGYGSSKPGSVGIVMKVGSRYTVEFTKLTGDPAPLPATYDNINPVDVKRI